MRGPAKEGQVRSGQRENGQYEIQFFIVLPFNNLRIISTFCLVFLCYDLSFIVHFDVFAGGVSGTTHTEREILLNSFDKTLRKIHSIYKDGNGDLCS